MGSKWVIPENIPTLPYMGGILEFQGRGKVSWTGIMNAWGGGGGVSTLNLWRGKMAKASKLELVDLIAFQVCKSSTNQPQKQDKD